MQTCFPSFLTHGHHFCIIILLFYLIPDDFKYKNMDGCKCIDSNNFEDWIMGRSNTFTDLDLFTIHTKNHLLRSTSMALKFTAFNTNRLINNHCCCAL